MPTWCRCATSGSCWRGSTRNKGCILKKAVLSHFQFAAFVFVGTAVALSYFIGVSPAAASPLALAYSWSVLGYYGVLLTLIAVVILPLSLLPYTRWLLPVVAWLWLAYLVLDIATFNLYQFHINWVLAEMFLFDFRGMGIPAQILAAFIGIGGVLAGIVVGLYRLARTISPRHRVLNLAVLSALGLSAFGAHAVISIWAHYYAREEITQYNPYFPIFYPIQSHQHGPSISAGWPSLFPAQRGHATLADNSRRGIVHYPAKTPECSPQQLPSILLIAIESWQASSLTPEIMPKLSKFATSATRYENHVSSGSSTVPGLFGLLYGLHPTYYDLMKASPNSHPSIFTETLASLGYRSRVFTSSSLERFAMRQMFFPKVASPDFVEIYSDEAIVDSYLSTLKRKESGKDHAPRFDFMFLTSSHSPYEHPPEYTRFKPLPTVKGGYAMDKMTDARPYKNQYHNSLAYVDALLGKLFANPEWQRRLANTWVVITGDHAEEFNENGIGHWGHGSNFSRWQTQTPLIVLAPGNRPAAVESRLTLHQDVVPTLMQEALGCRNPSDDYANGGNLFAPPEQRGTVLSSYFASAYLVDGTINDRTTGKKYAWDDVKQARPLNDPQAIRRLIDEERQFLSDSE